jgi:hypothetical protein
MIKETMIINPFPEIFIKQGPTDLPAQDLA